MPVRALSRFFALLFLLSIPAMGQSAPDAPASLPDAIGDFRADGAARTSLALFQGIRSEDFNITSSVARSFRSPNGARLVVAVVRTRDDSSAFALLTHAAERTRSSETIGVWNDVGRAGFASPNRAMFFRGVTFVQIQNEASDTIQDRLTLARAIAETLDAGANAVPPLVQHLPEWPGVQERAVYAVSRAALQETVGGESLLDELTFNEATEAATASYDSAGRLVVIEYRTPQLAADNDRRIAGRIEDLRRNGERTPSVYRRTGNYLIFVFNAPNEEAAMRLADGVRYEQQITWLDENPFALRQAQRNFDIAASSLIVAAFKFSGVALIVCLSVGSLSGGLIFLRRRAQTAAAGTYTDAGGMVRLNIDRLTPETSSPRPLLSEKNS